MRNDAKKVIVRRKGLATGSRMPVLDHDYREWIGELKKRYRATQIKAAVAVNSALIEFYWNLGKDISEKYPGKVRDAGFFRTLSEDLRLAIPDAIGLSVTNIKYARYFYELYSGNGYRQHLADDSENGCYRPQIVDDKILQHAVADLVRVPWGHHSLRSAMPTQKRSAPPQRPQKRRSHARRRKASRRNEDLAFRQN